MPSQLKRCTKCKQYTIAENKCRICGGTLEKVAPPRFSLEDKYQQYRIPYFKEKMKQKFNIQN
ncbi:MAG: nucleolar RNA-binding Nop10p family protein [Promethearchaeota archaeon]